MLVLYFIILMPIIPHLSVYHGDEQFYTNSAVYMMENKDFLTPHYDDGSIRTKKPILSYWAIMASFALFGVNFFAARLPFLMMGCLTLWVTYRLALRLFTDRFTAMLAVVVLASNFQFVSLSIRATPDIMQLLFLNISLYGFVALIFHNDFRIRNYCYAYYGAALAVLTKGAMGMILVAFIFLFLLFHQSHRHKIQKMVQWPVMITAFAIAFSWYLYMIFQYGIGSLWDFLSDQVVDKVGGSNYYVLANLKDYVISVFRNFLPWGLILLFAIPYRGAVQQFYKKHRQATLFVWGWFLLLLVIFIGIIDCRTRYLIPAYPLLAAWLASLFAAFYQHHHFVRFWRYLSWVVVIAAALLGTLLLWLGLTLDHQILIAVLIIAAGIFLSWYLGQKWGGPMPIFFPIGLLLLVLYSSFQAFVIPTFGFKPAHQIVSCSVGDNKNTGQTTIWSHHSADYLRQLYTVSNGRLRVRFFSDTITPIDLETGALAVLTQTEKHLFAHDQFDIEPCGYKINIRDYQTFSKALLSGNKDKVRDAMQEPIFLARRLQ